MEKKPIRALVVDDNQVSVTLMVRLLEGLGVEVVSADSGRLAIDLAFAQPVPFNIIFVDICMPDLNGNQVAQELREKGYTGAIVAFTATASSMGQAQSKKSGIDKYLGKQTLNKDLLRALLDSYCP